MQAEPMVRPCGIMFPARTRSPRPPMSACPARKFTKPASSAMPRCSTPASSAAPSTPQMSQLTAAATAGAAGILPLAIASISEAFFASKKSWYRSDGSTVRAALNAWFNS